MIEIPLSKQGQKYKGKYVAIVSDEDKDLSELRWNVFHNRDTNLYARCKGIPKSIAMHRVVMERILNRPLKDNELVDHVNRDGLDNRRENLRLATHSQNAANMRVQKHNKLGVKGVSRSKKRFTARIRFNGVLYFLGSFKTIEEASAAYEAKAVELFGEFARKS